jgi:hypothetical protein
MDFDSSVFDDESDDATLKKIHSPNDWDDDNSVAVRPKGLSQISN